MSGEISNIGIDIKIAAAEDISVMSGVSPTTSVEQRTVTAAQAALTQSQVRQHKPRARARPHTSEMVLTPPQRNAPQASNAGVTDITEQFTKLKEELEEQVKNENVNSSSIGWTILKVIAGLACPAAGLAYLLCEYPRTVAETEEVKAAFLNPSYAKFVSDRCDECLSKREENGMDWIRRRLWLGMKDPVTRNGLANSYEFVKLWKQHEDRRFTDASRDTFKGLCDGSIDKGNLTDSADDQAALNLYLEMQLLFRKACLIKRSMQDGDIQQGVPVYSLAALRQQRVLESQTAIEAARAGAAAAMDMQDEGGNVEEKAKSAREAAERTAQRAGVSRAAQTLAADLAEEVVRSEADITEKAIQAGDVAALSAGAGVDPTEAARKAAITFVQRQPPATWTRMQPGTSERITREAGELAAARAAQAVAPAATPNAPAAAPAVAANAQTPAPAASAAAKPPESLKPDNSPRPPAPAAASSPPPAEEVDDSDEEVEEFVTPGAAALDPRAAEKEAGKKVIDASAAE